MVCIDGHHRIAAYRLRNHKKPIKCEWFAGTPKEAVDESMRRNKKDTLPIPSADRREEAWRRVLLNPGSKKEIADACGVGPSTVANMRKAKRRYETDPEYAANVDGPLLETSWGVMLVAAYSEDADEFDLEERAGVLSRTISRKLTDLLKRDPVVTAHALAKYHSRLPRALMDVWSGQMPIPAARNLSEPEMKKQAETLRQRADAIEAMLAKRDEERAEALREATRRQEEEARKRAKLRFPDTPSDDFDYAKLSVPGTLDGSGL
jgi:hypothetical protein